MRFDFIGGIKEVPGGIALENTVRGGAMKVVIDDDLCEGNAVCTRVCPEVFDLQDDDTLHLRTEHPDESMRTKIEEAVRRCPRQALKLIEDWESERELDSRPRFRGHHGLADIPPSTGITVPVRYAPAREAK